MDSSVQDTADTDLGATDVGATHESPLSEHTVQAVDDVQPETAPETAARTDRRVAEIISRVDALTAAIERHPDSPVNYVLRGEALLEGGDHDLAADDFMKALELAEPRAETANWGYLSRALADRARDGLRRART